MSKYVFIIIMAISLQAVYAQTGNHVFGGAEAVNFGVVDLATPGGQTWSTHRAAAPGYFSAVGSATYTGALDGTAYVDGYVKYYAEGSSASSFIYPVGQGGDLRTLTISGIIPPTAILATAWVVGDPTGNLDPTSTGAPSGIHPISSFVPELQNISPVGQWDWQDLSSNAEGVIITVSIPDMTGFTTTAERLRLVGWNGTEWINLSAAQGNASGSGLIENSSLTGTMQSGISAIGIGNIKIPVAVDDTISTPMNTPVEGSVVDNDTCGNGPCSYSPDPSGTPSNGTVVINPDGTYTYTPDPLFIGNDTFKYVLCDVDNNCDTAQVVVMVDAPLSAELTSFSGKQIEACTIELQWQTGKEEHFKQFDIEYSRDAVQYKNIGSIEVTGNNSRFTYYYKDVEAGDNYFRLKLKDQGGSYSYSSVIRVNTICQERTIEAYPTVTDNIVRISGLREQEFIKMYDMQGRLLINRKAGTTTETLNLANLAQGLYNLVIITDRNETVHIKVVKK